MSKYDTGKPNPDTFQAPGRLYKPSKHEADTLRAAGFTECIRANPKAGFVRRMQPVERPGLRMTIEARMEKHGPKRWRAAIYLLTVKTHRIGELNLCAPGETLASRRPCMDLAEAAKGEPKPIAGAFGHVLWKLAEQVQRREIS